jgi:hypothetical protein
MTPAKSDRRTRTCSPHALRLDSWVSLLTWLAVMSLVAAPAMAQAPPETPPPSEAPAEEPSETPTPAPDDDGEEEEGDEEEQEGEAEEDDEGEDEGADDDEGDDDSEEDGAEAPGDDDEGDDDSEEDGAEAPGDDAPALSPTLAPQPAEAAPEATTAPEEADPAPEVEPAEPSQGEEVDPTAPVDPATAKKPAGPEVIEGELGNIGAVGLVPWKNRVGIIIGIERIGEIFYGAARPEINYTRDIDGKELSMSFGIPVRFELLDNRLETKWENIGAFRDQDWDEVSDYAQVLRFLRFGGKESHFFLDVNSFSANTVGHGVLLKRYNPNLNLNTTQVSLQLDAFSDYVGGETYLNNITGPSVMGVLLFLKPLSIIDRDNFFLRSFSLGFTVVGDVNAPMRNRLDVYDVDDDGRRLTEIQINQSTFQPEYHGMGVIGYGLDLEFKLVDTRELDWKMYFDQSFLETGVPVGDEAKADGTPYTQAIRSGGFTWGNLFRTNLGTKTVHALRFRTEYRNYDPNYLPSYFDTLYEIQRVQYFNGLHERERDLENDTKLQRVLGRSILEDRIHGVYMEGSWRIGNTFALSLGLEWNDRTPDNSLYLHAEVPRMGNWSFMASYQHRGAKDFGDIFNLTLADTDVLLMKTRYGLFDSVHVNLEVLTPFGIGPESLFRNDIQVNLNAEIGFEYL